MDWFMYFVQEIPKHVYCILCNKHTRLINTPPSLKALGMTFAHKNCHNSLNSWPIFNAKPPFESSEAQLSL